MWNGVTQPRCRIFWNQEFTGLRRYVPAASSGGPPESRPNLLLSALGAMGTAQPNWDLDQYILNYSGHGQIHRLLFIALKCPALQADAFKYAIRLIKETTLDVSLYQETVEKLQQVLPSCQEATPDRVWMEHASRTAKANTERLEAELKNYKNNLIKESIRVRSPCSPASSDDRWGIWTWPNIITVAVIMTMHSNATREYAITAPHRNICSISA